MEAGKVAAENDRRVFERVAVELPGSVLDSQTSAEITGDSCDVSARGLGVVCDRTLDVGSSVELWVRLRGRRDPFYTRGSIAWAGVSGQGGRRRMGIVFEKAQLMELSAVLRLA